MKLAALVGRGNILEVKMVMLETVCIPKQLERYLFFLGVIIY